MKLTFVKSKDAGNVKYELYKIEDYEVIVSTYDSGYKCISVSKRERERYLPEIFCKDDFEGNILGFEIQTTSYGAMNVEDIQKVIAGYNKAIEIVEVLTKEFVK